jgi:hypothetical protein
LSTQGAKAVFGNFLDEQDKKKSESMRLMNILISHFTSIYTIEICTFFLYSFTNH